MLFEMSTYLVIFKGVQITIKSSQKTYETNCCVLLQELSNLVLLPKK